jgi:hypothetical protein
MNNRVRTSKKSHTVLAYFILALAFAWIVSLVYPPAFPKGGRVLPGYLTFPGALVW